ncbi:MAG: hypothetical protein KatS3mg102_0831 [Planctomycetota bacterium]|nr:MAG: hypothetical protein KatS3mg102_0831 [Planctomycetota bacterium]
MPPVSENPPGYRRPWRGRLHCVRYERAYLLGIFAEAGLELVRFEHGIETDGQSALLFVRRD